jgi:peptidyl-prolyl cis-trans isomerase-like 4
MASKGPDMNASQFFITLDDKEIKDLNKQHTMFGVVAEGLEVLEKINKAYCDPKSNRPYQNIRIKHTVILDDPTPSIPGFKAPSRSPSPMVVKTVGVAAE